jgi:hypothetical protein
MGDVALLNFLAPFYRSFVVGRQSSATAVLSPLLDPLTLIENAGRLTNND